MTRVVTHAPRFSGGIVALPQISWKIVDKRSLSCEETTGFSWRSFTNISMMVRRRSYIQVAAARQPESIAQLYWQVPRHAVRGWWYTMRVRPPPSSLYLKHQQYILSASVADMLGPSPFFSAVPALQFEVAKVPLEFTH